jgi:hypothetical protein
MEAVFTLPYPEYSIASLFQKHFTKADNFSVMIPLSRQQKGIDLLLYNLKNGKSASVQVKSSRTWEGEEPKRNKERKIFDHYSWTWNFDDKYKPGLADYYAIFILYPKKSFSGKIINKAKKVGKWWEHKVLIFNDKEMGEFLTMARSKGHTFSFAFDEDNKDLYYVNGEFQESFNNNLFKNKISEIKKYLD